MEPSLQRSCLDDSCRQCLHVYDPSPLGWPFQFHYFHLTTSNLIIIFQQVRKCTVHLIWSLGSSEPSKNLVIQTQPSTNKTLLYHNSCTGALKNHSLNLTLVGLVMTHIRCEYWTQGHEYTYLCHEYTERPNSICASHKVWKCLLFLLPFRLCIYKVQKRPNTCYVSPKLIN